MTISNFCPTKDKLPKSQFSNVVYKITCPGCCSEYIGKTDRNFSTRIHEHATRENEPMFKHLSECAPFEDSLSMLSLEDANGTSVELNKHLHIKNALENNSEAIVTGIGLVCATLKLITLNN